MHKPPCRFRTWPDRIGRAAVLVLALLVCGVLSGCAALTNPVANGLPVRHRLPPELLAVPKAGTRPLPLTLLRQKPPEPYRLGPGDVLGIWVEGVLGERNQLPPVQVSESHTLPPVLGFPIPIRSDGSIPLPLIEPVDVRGMTVEEAQAAIQNAYTKKEILKPGRERVLVALMRRRVEHILVFREDAGTTGAPAPSSSIGTRSVGVSYGAGGTAGSLKRGTGFAVDLPAYENDVLHALAQTGGLPGLDAVNEVVIQRGSFPDGADREAFLNDLGRALQTGATAGQTVRIPLRFRPGEAPSIQPEDVILHTGDIVYIEAREAEFFYTGGLLPAGQFVVPRDYDLDVVQAISLVAGPMVSGGLNPINLSGTFITSGIGFPSPSLVSIIRRTPGGGQAVIRVDLNRALRDPRERILIQPRDVVLLQETPSEALARYFTEVFKFNFIWTAIHGPHETGATTTSVP